MLNQLVLVGRIVSIRDVKKDNKKIMKVGVLRNYKNECGNYDTDIIRIDISNNLGNNVRSYCKKGDMVGVKGRVVNENSKLVIIGEKITFLSSKRSDE